MTSQSMLNFVARKSLEPSAVSGPVGGAVGGDASIVVQVYAIGAGITLVREGGNLVRTECPFEFEAGGKVFVIDPLHARHAHWLVSPVDGDVAAVRKTQKAVDQEDLPKFRNISAHCDSSEVVTFIVSLPQGFGKSTIADALSRELNCVGVWEEWHPGLPLCIGALHLTNEDLEVS